MKYGEMNDSRLRVHECRVTELIIAIRTFLCSREEDKAKQRKKILSRWKQLCKNPGGIAAHLLACLTLLISRFYFIYLIFFFCIGTVTMGPRHFKGVTTFKILPFYKTAAL